METKQFYCTHCGDTRTFKSDDARVEKFSKGDAMCKICLQGKIVPVI